MSVPGKEVMNNTKFVRGGFAALASVILAAVVMTAGCGKGPQGQESTGGPQQGVRRIPPSCRPTKIRKGASPTVTFEVKLDDAQWGSARPAQVKVLRRPIGGQLVDNNETSRLVVTGPYGEANKSNFDLTLTGDHVASLKAAIQQGSATAELPFSLQELHDSLIGGSKYEVTAFVWIDRDEAGKVFDLSVRPGNDPLQCEVQ